ncbi:MAG TPA: SRPBCC family protein [Myxococcaceae bacterium]|nr:SRPBCC family protein [Myxococcaceae bacterium]
MRSNDYAFLTRWRVQGTVAEVKALLSDAASLPRWWPSVYLEVQVLVPGDAAGVGKTVDLLTQGWLPYRLRWRFVTTEVRPDGFTLEASGDFEGRGVWTFVQDGEAVDVTYDWRIRARKALLRSLSWLMKPVFAANHRWAMARGEESLALELRRRRARTDAERAAIPESPGPMLWGRRG